MAWREGESTPRRSVLLSLWTFVLQVLCGKRQRHPAGPEAARLDRKVDGLAYNLSGPTTEELAIGEGSK